ncbi:unnamed protein product [Rotaria socialis]|uniref:Uncharacterized protein n=1 Tax=Rotaria socialis TaxID=392032 RepID=A0A817VBH9_9BILA|nr:unnamed protein product [Rotaria socialis]CAF4939730.1 unnamed protein product [Rotaria socialis]
MTSSLTRQVVTINPLGFLNEVFTPSFGNLPATELTAFRALYDQVKFCAFKVTYKPRGNIANVGASASTMRIYSVIDRTDATPLINVDAALEYQNCKATLLTRQHSRYIKCTEPVLLRDINNAPMLSVSNSRWLQLDDQTISGTLYSDAVVAHLGLKVITDPNPSPTNIIYLDRFVKIYLQFKTRK